MATDAEILQAIKDAIYDIVATNKATVSVSLGERGYRHYSLTELQAMQEYYERKVALSTRRLIILADVSRGDS